MILISMTLRRSLIDRLADVHARYSCLCLNIVHEQMNAIVTMDGRYGHVRHVAMHARAAAAACVAAHQPHSALGTLSLASRLPLARLSHLLFAVF
jgi:hypothetical protein